MQTIESFPDTIPENCEMLLIPSIPLHNAAKHTWTDEMCQSFTRMYLLLKYADSARKKCGTFEKDKILFLGDTVHLVINRQYG